MMANDFTVADVLAWARTKPADEEYDFCDPGNCAIAQFGRETGRAGLSNLACFELEAVRPGLLDALNPGYTHRCGFYSYGGLVERLEALAPAEPSPWLNPQTYIDCDCGQVSA
jgi:hypothetical protein